MLCKPNHNMNKLPQHNSEKCDSGVKRKCGFWTAVNLFSCFHFEIHASMGLAGSIDIRKMEKMEMENRKINAIEHSIDHTVIKFVQ